MKKDINYTGNIKAVGIILVSHDGFAEGILRSGTVVFGKQGNVKAVTLMSSEGPGDVRAKTQEVTASFDNQDEALFLVGLWGGTPFNQVNSLLGDHKDKRAAVAGVNLPVVIEAYVSRSSMESAQEIATHILEIAKDGVRIKPGELQPAEVPKAAATGNVRLKGSLPPDTVADDGKIKFVLAHIDSRLLYGQVAAVWIKAAQPNKIIVVSDTVAKDDLRKKLTEQAAPPGVKANVIPISKMIEVTEDSHFGNTKALLLFENSGNILEMVEGGVEIPEVNVGSTACSVGKVAVSKVLSIGQEDADMFDKLKTKGIRSNMRRVPDDSRVNMNEILKKAENELANT